VYQNKIQTWKNQLLEQADTVFDCSQEQKISNEAHLKNLHAKIGELALENDFLSKALEK